MERDKGDLEPERNNEEYQAEEHHRAVGDVQRLQGSGDLLQVGGPGNSVGERYPIQEKRRRKGAEAKIYVDTLSNKTFGNAVIIKDRIPAVAR